MKKLKKLVSLTLAAAMVIALAACGDSSDSEKSSTQAPAKEEVAASSSATVESTASASEETEAEAEKDIYPIVDEPITIRCGVVGKSGDLSKGRIVWNMLEEITGINIEYVSIEKDALATYLAGGNWPDFFIAASWSNSVLNDYGVVGGKFLNYFDYLEYMPNLVQTFEDYPLVKAAVTESNGAAYGLPNVEDSATVVSARTLVRTDILEDNGCKMPTTVDEFYETLKTLKEKTGVAQWVPEVSDDESNFPIMVYAAFGTETNMNFDDDGTGKVIFNRTSEQMKRYLTFMNKLYSEELIHQEFLTMDSTVRNAASAETAFPDGGAANAVEAAHFADGQFHLDGIEPLTSEYDSTQEILGTNNFRGMRIVINADTEYAEEICRMLDATYAVEEIVEGSGLNGMSFCYGIEGKDWYCNDDGETYSLIAPDEYEGVFHKYQYGEVTWFNTGRNDAIAGLTTNTPGNSCERQKSYVKGVHPFMSEGYFPVSLLKFNEDEQYVIDNKLTDIKTYYKEMEGKFITGAADIETEWETYCNTLTKMGIEDVIAAYQSSYDRWLEAIK